MAARQLSDARADGQVIGQSATDTLAFFGGTPAAQRSGSSQAAVGTASATQLTTAWGFTTATQANGIVTLVNEIRATLDAHNLFKGSA